MEGDVHGTAKRNYLSKSSRDQFVQGSGDGDSLLPISGTHAGEQPVAEEAVEVVTVATQTFDDVFTEDESKQVAQKIVENLMTETTAAMNGLMKRIQDLEKRAVANEQSRHVDSDLTAPFGIGHGVPTHVDELGIHSSLQSAPSGVLASSLQTVREAHYARRRELKEERRRARQAIITAQDGILPAKSTNSSDPDDF